MNEINITSESDEATTSHRASGVKLNAKRLKADLVVPSTSKNMSHIEGRSSIMKINESGGLKTSLKVRNDDMSVSMRPFDIAPGSRLSY